MGDALFKIPQTITMTVITIVNQKGGVAKTTSAMNIAGVLATMGYKVGLIDLDSQGSLTKSLLGDADNLTTVYDSLLDGFVEPDDEFPEENSNKEVSLPFYPIRENLSICPCTLEMARFDVQASLSPGGSRLLAAKIDKLKKTKQFDYVIMDCPPNLGFVVVNALLASNYVLVPVLLEFFTLQMARGLQDIIKQCRRENKKLKTLGVFAVRVKKGKLGALINDQFKEIWADKWTAAFVRESTLLQESAIPKNGTIGSDILAYKPNSIGSNDYIQLTIELLERMGVEISQ